MCQAMAGNRYHRTGQIRKALKASGLTIRMEVGRCLDPNPKLATVLSKPTKRGSITTRWFPLPPDVK